MTTTREFGAGIMTGPADGPTVHDATTGEYAPSVPAPAIPDIARYDCTMTLVSPHTGDHRTFRVKSHHKGSFAGRRTVELLVNGEGDYRAFGFVIPEPFGKCKIVVFKAYRGEPSKASAHEVYARMLLHPEHYMARGVTYAFARRCRRCGRELTTPTSIENGIGPECIKYE